MGEKVRGLKSERFFKQNFIREGYTVRGGDSKIITMDNTFKSAILEELREKEIDISKDDYYQKPAFKELEQELVMDCLLYTSPSPRD